MEPWQVAVRWALVGDGGRVVRRTSHWWEMAVAAREHRRPLPLYHCALALTERGRTTVVEMTPTWGRAARGPREVVATGAVASPLLGRTRLFRYEVRYTAGTDHTATQAVVGIGRDAVDAVRLSVPRVPRLTWGRRAGAARDMWTSNSVVSWVLADTGLLGDLRPPAGGRAPGWEAGISLGVSSAR